MDPRDFQSLLRKTVLLPAVLLALLAALLVWQVIYLNRAFIAAQESNRFSLSARQFLRYALDMETGVRGYLLTKDQRFLEPYKTSAPLADERLHTLAQMAASDQEDSQNVRDLSAQFEEFRAYCQRMVDPATAQNSGRDVGVNLEGKRSMDELRASLDRLISGVERDRLAQDHAVRLATNRLLVLIGLFTVVIGIILSVATHRSMSVLMATYARHVRAERERATDAEHARGELLTTLGSIAEAVIATDSEGCVNFINPVAASMLQVHLRDVAGKTLEQALSHLPEHTRAEIIAPVRQSTEHKAAISAAREVDLPSREARVSFIEYSASPVLASNGTFLGSVLIIRDITERRRSESALRSSERLALIGRLAATIAHEIRNPLDAVLNLVYLIRRERVSDTVADFAETADAELRRIAQITNQLLAFNREAREPVQVDVPELIDSVLALFQPKLSKSGIELQTELRDSPKVVAFPGELRQVISNLVANAIDAMPNGGRLRVRVTSAHDPIDDRSGIRITIADTGPGIPDAVREHLFAPFFTTKGEKGTGLGLWVSRGIVTKHQGRVSVHSRTGERHGTAFSIFLPSEPNLELLRGTAA